jgi:cobalamin biosynthesis protein CobT
MRTTKTAPEGWVQYIRSLARNHKLKVVIGKNVGPATDGDTLWLPSLPAQLTPDDLVLFKGNAHHELGHIRQSNIKFFQAYSKQHGSFAQFLLNALDDVFMEGREAAWKPTVSRYLLDSTMVLIKRDQFRDGSAGLGEAVACYCLSYLTAKRWPTVGVSVIRIEANLRKHLAEHADKVIPALTDLLDTEFPAVNSTEDGGALGLKIIELLKSLAEQEQNQPSPSKDEGEGDADGSSESDPSQSDGSNDSDSDSKDEVPGDGKEEKSKPEGEGQGKGESESDSESKDEGEGNGESGDSESEQDGEGDGAGDGESADSDPQGDDQGKGNNGSNDKNGEGEGDGEQDQDGKSQSDSNSQANSNTGKSLQQMVDEMLKEELGNQEVFDKGAAVKELAESIASGANKAYEGQPQINGLVMDFSTGAGKCDKYADGMQIVEVDRDMAKIIADVTSRKANVMANRLRALLANREETEQYASRTGRLCERNLDRFAIDDSRLFEKSEERVEETAAVSITADLSGSTGCVNNGTSVAEQIRIALTMIEKVLHEVGTPREILGFAPNNDQLNCMVKTFGDNHRVALDRIAGMHRLVGGCSTPIGEAVMQAGMRLLGHESQRKLLFVVTDGLPTDVQHAKDMTDAVLRSGVEVIYLVIGSESGTKWLSDARYKFAHSENAEGLIPALVSKVAEFLN